MIKNWLTRYHPKYVRALVYMLQASEYNIDDYLRWHSRANDFGNIEHRKQLVKTSKAVLILIVAWLMVVSLFVLAIFVLLSAESILDYAVGIIILIASPYILAYLLLLPVFVIKVAQWPVKYSVVKRATQKLSQHPSLKIAIAGSYGKTSMREILKTVISEGKKVSAAPHSYNTPLGIAKFVSELDDNDEVLIFEFGEYYPGDVAELSQMVKPDMGLITGVNQAHLEKFKTLERTVSTIFELADWLGNKPVYVNGENSLAKTHSKSDFILYSREGVGSWKIKDAQTSLAGTKFVLYNDSQEIPLSSKLLGLHQVGPLAAAAHVALALGLSVDQVKAGIEKTAPFDHRLQPKIDNGVVIIDDSYNGNPDGVQAIIEFLATLTDHRRWYVTPGLVEMGDQSEEIHKKIGTALAEAQIEKIVLMKNSVTGHIADGLKQAEYKGEIIWFDDAIKAYNSLPQMTVAGDVVVLQNDWPDQYA